jgi:hypothetical protein
VKFDEALSLPPQPSKNLAQQFLAPLRPSLARANNEFTIMILEIEVFQAPPLHCLANSPKR